jgi:hypothetical protein
MVVEGIVEGVNVHELVVVYHLTLLVEVLPHLMLIQFLALVGVVSIHLRLIHVQMWDLLVFVVVVEVVSLTV